MNENFDEMGFEISEEQLYFIQRMTDVFLDANDKRQNMLVLDFDFFYNEFELDLTDELDAEETVTWLYGFAMVTGIEGVIFRDRPHLEITFDWLINTETAASDDGAFWFD